MLVKLTFSDVLLSSGDAQEGSLNLDLLKTRKKSIPFKNLSENFPHHQVIQLHTQLDSILKVF